MARVLAEPPGLCHLMVDGVMAAELGIGREQVERQEAMQGGGASWGPPLPPTSSQHLSP